MIDRYGRMRENYHNRITLFRADLRPAFGRTQSNRRAVPIILLRTNLLCRARYYNGVVRTRPLPAWSMNRVYIYVY